MGSGPFRNSVSEQLFGKEVEDSLDTRLVALFGERGVVTLGRILQFDRDERIAKLLPEHREPVPDQLVAGEAETEYLAAVLRSLNDRSLVVRRQVEVRAPLLLATANGIEGCAVHGASMMSSTIIPSAKPPEKHMPTAPTPGPPTSLWMLRASARSQAMTGDVLFIAIVVNSLAMQIFIIDCAM